jgi:hypothetical protein
VEFEMKGVGGADAQASECPLVMREVAPAHGWGGRGEDAPRCAAKRALGMAKRGRGGGGGVSGSVPVRVPKEVWLTLGSPESPLLIACTKNVTMKLRTKDWWLKTLGGRRHIYVSQNSALRENIRYKKINCLSILYCIFKVSGEY